MHVNTPKIIGISSLILVGILFGLSGVIAKYLSPHLNAYQVVEYRFAIALLGALLLAILTKYRLSIAQRDKKAIALFAFSFPISVILFTLAIFHTTVALAVFSFYIATLASSFLFGRLFFDERIHRYKLIAFALMVLAICIFTNPLGSASIDIGFYFGIMSGIVQAAASSFQKHLSHNTNRLTLLIIQATAGVVLSMLILLVLGEPLIVSLTSPDWVIATIFGLSMLAISYLFLVGFKHINLNTGSILVSSELLFGPLFAMILLSEQLEQRVVIGGLITAIAAIVANLPDPDKQD